MTLDIDRRAAGPETPNDKARKAAIAEGRGHLYALDVDRRLLRGR